MTIKEVINETKMLENVIEKNRQKAAYAARKLWNILEYPQVADNQEEIRTSWTEVADTLADLRDVVGEYNKLMNKEVKKD